MMEELFIRLLNVSISASFFILAIILFRYLFKRAPKFISVLLFGLVGIRLFIPFRIESEISLVPSADTLPEGAMLEKYPMIESGIPVVDEIVNPYLGSSFTATPEYSINPLQVVIAILSVIWIAVTIAMIAYLTISSIILKLKLRESVLYEDRIYLNDKIKTPFIFGIVKPKIYIPSSIDQNEIEIIAAHEMAHIKRLDYLWKPIAFIALSVYWFNPLIWLGYHLLSQDIELACDEKVMKDYSPEQKVRYSEILLNISKDTHSLGACPLAFGEVGVKERIKRIGNYTKPATVIVILSVIMTFVLGACFLTDKVTEAARVDAGIYYAYGTLYSSDNASADPDAVPLFIFFENGDIIVESKTLQDGTYGNIGAVHKCYLSKKDYLRLFENNETIVERIRKYNNTVYRAEPPSGFTAIDCDEVYIFVQSTGEIFLGYGYGYDDKMKIKELYSLKMNETLPTNYMIATYKEKNGDPGFTAEFTIDPTSSKMSMSFGLLSSYFAIGTYEIKDNKIIFTPNDTLGFKFVFDISGENPKFIASESQGYTWKEDKEFERVYEKYSIPASLFYDVGGDGRYEYVSVAKSEIDGEFALSFNVYARGDSLISIKTKFKKYDYLELIKDETTSELTLICYNKELLTERDRYTVKILDDSVIITPIN